VVYSTTSSIDFFQESKAGGVREIKVPGIGSKEGILKSMSRSDTTIVSLLQHPMCPIVPPFAA